MHEVSIMAEAVRMAVESARAAGATRIIGLRLRVGRLSGVVPEAMHFAWEVVRAGTIAAEAGLEIKTIEAVAWCEQCRTEFESADLFTVCPHCQCPPAVLRHGRELEIEAVEIVTDETLVKMKGHNEAKKQRMENSIAAEGRARAQS
jgi:hydrogenase nickel incorporation protein HypA/HybF